MKIRSDGVGYLLFIILFNILTNIILNGNYFSIQSDTIA